MITRRSRTGTRVEVRVAAQGDKAKDVLGRVEHVQTVEPVDGHLLVVLDRETHDFSPLARALLDANIPLREIKEEPVNLETAFMRFTKGIVQ